MSKSSGSDSGVGSAVLTTRIGLSVQAVRMCIMYGMLPGILVPLALWFWLVSPLSLSIVKIDALTHVFGSGTAREWRVTRDDGSRAVVVATLADGREVQEFTGRQIPQVLAASWRPVRVFRNVLWGALALGLIGHLAVWLSLRRMGRDKQEAKRIRGAKDLVTSKELSRLVRASGASRYKLVDVPLPREAPMMGIAMLGAQGSGKSQSIHDLMLQVFKQQRKCFIYDQAGEYYKAHFRPGKDHFFNPALIGSVPWSLPGELTYAYDADSLGRAFLPPRGDGAGGANAFFEDAARSLFSVILLRLRERGAKYTPDIAKAFLEMPEDEMALLIEKSIASSAIDGDSKAQRQGVISSIAIYLNGILAVQRGAWTIKKFLEGPEDSRLFIYNTEDTRAMFAPLYRLMLSVAFMAIEAQGQIVHFDRYWFFLDEVNQIGDIRLDERLAILRKFGVCIVTGLQSDTQLAVSLGQNRGDVVLNGFNTMLMLRVQEEKLQKRMAARIGEKEETTVNQNQQLALVATRDGGGLNQVDRDTFVVKPSEFGYLDTNTGFLKLAGNLPAAKVDYRAWLPTRPGQITRLSLWRERHPAPERDPSFAIQVGSADDVFASVRQEVEDAKAAAAEIEADDAPPALMWAVTELDDLDEEESRPTAAAASAPSAPAAADDVEAVAPSPAPAPKGLKF